MKPESSTDTVALDVDARLREAMADEPPPEVAARLENRVAGFLEEHRRSPGREAAVLAGRPLVAAWHRLVTSFLDPGWARGVLDLQRRWAVPAALALLAGGTSLQLVSFAGGPAAGDPVPRLSAVVSLSDALARAGPPTCASTSHRDALSPEALSERVYRSWVLVGSGPANGSDTRLLFRALDEPALYEVDVAAGTFRPRRLRRTGTAGARAREGGEDVCAWEEPPGPGAGAAERRPR